MNRFLHVAWIAIALLLAAATTPARIRTYPASVEIGMADAIVIGTAIQFQDSGGDEAPVVTFAAEQYLRGSGPRDQLRASLPRHSDLIEVDGATESQRCGQVASTADDAQRRLDRMVVIGGSTLGIRCRERYVLYLGRNPAGEFSVQRAFLPTETERMGVLRNLLAHVPSWGKPHRGLAAMLVTDTPRVGSADDIEVSLGLKNVGELPVVLHFGGARDERSHFTLSIVGPDGQRVAAQPHPELDADSMAYFFRHMSAVGTRRLEPGEATFLPSEPINTAGGGWGYKEQLDFSYYPLPQPGRYRIMGTARRFLPDAEPQTETLEIWVD